MHSNMTAINQHWTILFRKFADPGSTANRKRLGDSNHQHTKRVSTCTIMNKLPLYFISMAGERVKYDAFIEGDREDYGDELDYLVNYQLEKEV